MSRSLSSRMNLILLLVVLLLSVEQYIHVIFILKGTNFTCTLLFLL